MEPTQDVIIARRDRRRQAMESIKEILIRRDGLSADAAESLIEEAREDFNQRLATGELPEDICQDWFGLEPDYLMELI